ncbi:tyrosine-type recombinase/integrase [Halobacterium salinarum]|uniref:tyrosine-type recombinase/integrase n=1 Tax=Halobacterium salinarum TaxID=2242 RepID=UPI001F404AD4|nr:tyrosine-type recombinase/integrase [Halobacterium salinarum]MCF2164871.1 tyrosine-type recombinase/integrase [Halobacterium salinarum]MCF2168504.1 tyrosine-type recombinase/integrase [Halobacterium salinarum]
MTELQPMDPTDAVQMYLQAKEGELAEATVREHRYRLKNFKRWCADSGIENTNELNGRTLYEFRLWRRDNGDLSTLSLRNQLSCLRAFIRWCENVDAVPQGLHEKIELPNVNHEESSRDEVISEERAETIRTHLYKFKYATREHTLFELLWHTGVRIGIARALDVDDFDQENQRIEVVHRPESGTPLKNGDRGGRFLALNQRACEVVEDWINTNRPDVGDDHGREPLFASTQGRAHKTTLRRTVYRVSQPCLYAECPHDRDPSECDAKGYDGGNRCPSGIDPHTIRRSAITHFLSSDIPQQVIEDRMNVSAKVLDEHYDKRSEEQKVEQRRGYLDGV